MNLDRADAVLAYEQLFRQDRAWSMSEGDRHFQGDNAVFQTLWKIARCLEDMGVPYAVAGGMALDAHGFRRLTVDVNILVTREGLKEIHDRLEGLGWVPPFTGSKQLRDTEHGVRVEFRVAGEFPGDGKPKPVAFPDPSAVNTEIGGIRYINLPTLVELKIASRMTNPGRLKDVGDVQSVIKSLEPSRTFAEQLNPFVRERYAELWDGVQQDVREP
jgi:hypothetical protein